MSTTEQVIVYFAIDKITSGYNKDRENWNVEALLKMYIEARNLAIKFTPFVRILRTHQEHVYLLICYHLGIQLYLDMEYSNLSYITRNISRLVLCGKWHFMLSMGTIKHLNSMVIIF